MAAISANSNASHYDVAIIGGGVLGAFVARNLARYKLRVVLLERHNDVCCEVSKANSAIVYSGLDNKSGTLKTQLCIAANRDFAELCSQLGVEYKQCGSLMVAFGERGCSVLNAKLAQGEQNGVLGLELLDRRAVRKLEPNISGNIVAGLYSPTTGTVNPWQLGIAAAKNALQNGVEFRFGAEVAGIRSEVVKPELGILSPAQTVLTSNSPATQLDFSKSLSSNATNYKITLKDDIELFAHTVVNCSGLAAAKIANLVDDPGFEICPTRGDYIVLDTTAANHINQVIFSEGETKGKGATLVPTVDGNVLVGPSEEPPGQEPFASSADGLAFNRRVAKVVFPKLPLDTQIRNFSTLRPNPYLTQRDSNGQVVITNKSINSFLIEESPSAPGFFNVGGIKTPGLTCSDKIGNYVSNLVVTRLSNFMDVAEKTGFEPVLEPSFMTDTGSGLHDGEIVCRCKSITAAEVRSVIRQPLGARSVDGVKRRIGCGMGRCQGGFCTQRVIEILTEELDLPPTQIYKDDSDSPIVTGTRGHETKGDVRFLSCDDKVGSTSFDLVVVGGGSAGLAAAIGAHQAGVKSVLVIDRLPYLGGILPQCSHEGFGMRLMGRELTGIEYSQWLVDRFNRLNIPALLSSSVLSISKQRCIALNTPTGQRQIQAKAIILASGCRERTLASLPNISGTRPAGVLTAGSAQKMVNIAHWELGEKIVILGSGDVGMIMARQFVLQGKQVLAVLEQASKLGGLKRNKQRCLDAHNIPLILNTTISELHGTGRLAGVSIVSKEDKAGQGNSPSTVPTFSAEPSSTDPGSCFIPCDTLVTSIGLVPELELLHGLQTTLNSDKSIAPSSDFLGDQKINIPWLFLAGNAREVQAFVDNVVDDGNLAGTTAARYLKAL